jgi:tRNA (guanine37-N1)-methyltransferase
MRFDILTIFPRIFDSYFSHTLLARAQKMGLIKIAVHDIRKYAKDKHKTVDDRPYGGGVGMLMKVDVIFNALKGLKISPPPNLPHQGGGKKKKKFPSLDGRGKGRVR